MAAPEYIVKNQNDWTDIRSDGQPLCSAAVEVSGGADLMRCDHDVKWEVKVLSTVVGNEITYAYLCDCHVMYFLKTQKAEPGYVDAFYRPFTP
jgi:hypothetical protein